MGRHKEWRKIAKKQRRKKIRTLKAKEQDQIMLENEEWLNKQYALEIEQIEFANKLENEKWLQAEKNTLEQWIKYLSKKEILQQKRLEQEAKVNMEWEQEQLKKKAEEDRLKQIEEETKLKQAKFMESLEKFLSGDTSDPPPELLIVRETRPDMGICPFFSKTGCCRFSDQCSRNHQYPGISKVLLATNFYVHFGLNNTSLNEYDTDIMLEYEEQETYKEYKEFFYDILPEFKKFGKIVQLKVCNNYEKHLRGNTYVEFAELRCAVAAYRSLHSRWYGGRQLSLQFCQISSWKNAICGLQIQNRCPKGRACNFLHTFKNPDNMFPINNFSNQNSERSRRTPSSRSWRWSESPEVEIIKKTSSTRRSDRSDRRCRSRRQHEDTSQRHRRTSSHPKR